MTDPREVSEAGSPNEGLQRLKKLFDYSFAKYTPEEQLPPVPQEYKEWAEDTLLAAFAGVLLGGGMQWQEERRAGPVVPPAEAPSKAHIARAIAEEQTQRLARIANGATKGGLRVGGLAAVFYAVQMLSGVYRNQRDFHDTAYGGMAAGALLGFLLKHGGRLRSTVLGAALGASMGVPVGLLQDKVVEWMPEEFQQKRLARFAHTEDILKGEVKPDRGEAPVRDYDVTAAVIAQLEASLRSSPTQQQQAEGRQPAALEQQQGQDWGQQGEGRGGGEEQQRRAQQQQEQGGRKWWRLWR